MNRLANEAAYFGALQDGVDSQQERIAELEQQLAAKDNDAKDAARYRWLRGNNNDSLIMDTLGFIYAGDDLDAAIDKELKL